MRRKLLGTASDLVTRVRVYLTDDAIEIDEIEGYTGVRKRVLFDEVVLVTLDRRRRLRSLLIWGGLALMFATPGLFAMIVERNSAAPGPAFALFAAMASPFALVFLVHLAAGTDHVTVFGKRTTAQMRFVLRKRRARETFELLRDLVRKSQEPAETVSGAVPPPPPADAGSDGTAAA